MRTAQDMTGSHLEWAKCDGDVLHFSGQKARVLGKWPLTIGFLQEAIASVPDPGGPWLSSWQFNFEVCIHATVTDVLVVGE